MFAEACETCRSEAMVVTAVASMVEDMRQTRPPEERRIVMNHLREVGQFRGLEGSVGDDHVTRIGSLELWIDEEISIALFLSRSPSVALFDISSFSRSTSVVMRGDMPLPRSAPESVRHVKAVSVTERTYHI